MAISFERVTLSVKFRAGRFIPKGLKNRFREWRNRLRTNRRIRENRQKEYRCLEIGPKNTGIDGFEKMDMYYFPGVDYICDASRPLPFEDGTFDVIFSGHVLEHIAWYQTVDVLKEWRRILKPGGIMEIWTPDALELCRTLVEYEVNHKEDYPEDRWHFRYNPERNPYRAICGHLYCYGDGTGEINHPNWHHALFTPKYLKEVMEGAGLRDVRRLPENEMRGNPRWTDLGMVGKK